MRRFSRRRRAGSTGSPGGSPIDAGRWLQRLCDEKVVDVAALETLTHPEVPEDLAAVGQAVREDGTRLVVSFSPRHAGDALLAALATGGRLAEEEGFTGEVLAIAPQWSLAARRRLGLVRAELGYSLRGLPASALAEGARWVESEAALEPSVLPVGQVIAQVADAATRDLFSRATLALEGLASKHGGCVRGIGHRIELVVLARRVAELACDERGVVLNTLAPQRQTARLDADGFAAALDGLEGQLRKRLSDRKLREGEEGIKARSIPLLASTLALRAPQAWPVGGADGEDIDLIGVASDGRPVVAVVRQSLDLAALGPVLDAVQRLRISLPTLLLQAGPPLQIDTPRLVLAAEAFSAGALRVLAGLALAQELFELRADRERGLALTPTRSEDARRSVRERPQRGRWERGRAQPGRASADATADATGDQGADRDEVAEVEARSAPESGERGGRGPAARRRGRRRGRGRTGEDEGGREASGESADGGAEVERFESLSLLDLDGPERSDDDDESGAARRRRGRGRRRGRRGSNGDSEEPDTAPMARSGEEEDEPARRGRRRSGRPGSRREEGAKREPRADGDDLEGDEEDEDGLAEALVDLPEDLDDVVTTPDFLETVSEDVDEEEEGEDDEGDEAKTRRIDRERRRKARIAAKSEIVEAPRAPRRRAVVVAHADRDSVAAALLLARDIRLLEGVWVYPQSEVMTFFRSVATDLREDVPIYLVGFTPSPARDVIQAAALYRDRLTWFDHHDWPPEDLSSLREAIGAEAVHQAAGVGSCLPIVLETSTRRSRFSDKLVDLVTGRFTQHDFERWGRVWWWRLGKIAAKSGDVRADIEPLLAGRPSDLAKEASRLEAPPIPKEVEYVSKRDFRLVHFAGYTMVLLDLAPEYDVYLASRVARERYGSDLSLGYHLGSELFHLGGDESGGRRPLDFGALAEHLGAKLDWVESLMDQDHVARFRIRGLAEHPERLDEVIGEIAMGRSILER